MRRGALFIVLLGLTTLGAAQQSPLDRATSWLSTQWTRVQKEGRPAAERAVRQFPTRFKDLKSQVARLSTVAGQFSDAHHLEERKAFLLELWRVRGSLNLLALCSPEVIHQVTGLDMKTLTALQSQIAAARERVGERR